MKYYGYRYARNRLIVLARDGHVCWICGKEGADTADHIVPRAQGGTHDLDNMRAAHMRCNSARGGRMHVPAHKGMKRIAGEWLRLPRAKRSTFE